MRPTRQQAVSEYIDGATKELDVYRQQISAAARADNAQLLSDAGSRSSTCATGWWPTSNWRMRRPSISCKANYERTRGEMIKALQAAQKK